MNIPCGRRLAALVCGLAVLAGTGCKSDNPNAPVNAAKARETLQAALDSWKKGEPSNALEKASPPIYVIDPDWQAGVKLADFEILGPGEEKDAQLYARVRLVLRRPNGPDVTQEATFMVATAPNLTVARKVF
jgi:hypothetical protein